MVLLETVEQLHGVYIETAALPQHFSSSLWINGGARHPGSAASVARRSEKRRPIERNQILPTDRYLKSRASKARFPR